MQACNQPQVQKITAVDSCKFVSSVSSKDSSPPITPADYNNTKGYLENGELMANYDCPDAHRDFPPINIKLWNKTPAVNGRFPTYEETKNGTALLHYGEKTNSKIKPYSMLLPKLATYHNPLTKTNQLVVVIQIAQTVTDTVVSFRYITGGCGGNTFSNFHFLSNDEVKKATQ